MVDIPADYTQITLDSRALAHVRKRLEQGRTLGELLLHRPDLPEGRIATYLPVGTSEAHIYNFEAGILPEPPEETHRVNVSVHGIRGRLVPVPNMDVAVGAMVADFLALDSRRLCIFAHPLAESSDPWISSKSKRFTWMRVATFGTDVYMLITPTDMTEIDDLEEVIRHATSFWWSAALTSTPASFEAHHRMELAEDSLHELAAHAEHIIVEAYDNEGFIVWSKP